MHPRTRRDGRNYSSLCAIQFGTARHIRARPGGCRANGTPFTVTAAEFGRAVGGDPVPRCARPRRQPHHRRRRRTEPQSRKREKETATSVGSRSAAQAARAGRPAERVSTSTSRLARAREGNENGQRGPVNAAFDQGCWRRRPRGSFAPIARAPSALRTGISRKWKSTAPPAASPSARAGRAASRRRSQNAPRQGIKNTISPARNVGERARRRIPKLPEFQCRVLGDDPLAVPPAPPTTPSNPAPRRARTSPQPEFR
jgi:hypothetical protein